MNHELAVIEQRQLTAGDMRARVNLVQEVMQAVMKSDMHYGVIPGTKKPSLYKAGAEVLCATFRIADKYEVEDLSQGSMARFRVRCIGIHQATGQVLGEGMGECSSGEEKYKWRGSICQEEFDATPENMRRVKFSKYQGKVEKRQQVRTEPEDQANTVLKMACKRAKVAMTLNVTAASDIFTQDIEDLPPELQEREDARKSEAEPPKVPEPWPKDKFDAALAKHAQTVKDGKKTAADLLTWMQTKAPLTDAQKAAVLALKPVQAEPEIMASADQLALIRANAEDLGITEAEICKRFNIVSIDALPAGMVEAVSQFIADPLGA